MVVKLRLKRQGKKFQPHYRIVAVKARTKRDGESLEDLGHYSPMSKELVINKDRVEYWLGVGAQPTDTVKGLLIKEGIVKKDKNTKVYNKPPKQKSQERAAAAEEKAKEEEPVEEPKNEESTSEESSE
ncbi:30S ribosomal protein S16 [Candidatus Dojkabacteria bacterium]|uniref:Small ribosomal subunit protein bS16 n=1 Tax=Candidatus Dojkabacteria bacterium TaxID=2099670 RepID=A0A955RJW9_9BACT|nr:30S ribosomal protein S16 [Candidatus Dojkabacteria bacterium]